ncbi:MAG TPA: DUF72 domain-containing protein [bacterium]|nr:DUF72 domain-containing protein [bacterium]
MPANNSLLPDPRVYIGTSGFFYPDWKGVFYISSSNSEDHLLYYSRFFNALELNFSFYQMPESERLKRFADPALGGMTLSIKAYRGITHQASDSAVLDTFLDRIRILEDSGVLKTVLFQFPFAFQETADAWTLLDRIGRAGGAWVPVVEFRHSAWFTETNMIRFRDMGIAICATDMPVLRHLPGCRFHSTHPTGYMRFHGRNASNWWHPREAWERYDYLYSREELLNLLPDVKKWLSKHDDVYIFFNNHYRGQAVRNAQMLMAFLFD